MTTSISEYSMLRKYQNSVRPELMKAMSEEDTAIRFFLFGDDVYMARNLLDGKFVPYASVVMLCARDVLFRSINDLPPNLVSELKIDDELIIPADFPEDRADFDSIHYETSVDRHKVDLNAYYKKFHIWTDVPTLRFGILAAAALVIPMLLIVILFFYREVTKPTRTLLEANKKLEAGERGYTITEMPGNAEFRELTTQFNHTSTEMKNQFEQLYLEQQALQQARIKTLQSQINPHFLNNTLEVINWEARMADNEKISSMIEALSTMLNAALDRDNEGMIPLRQELQYVDAYLYIIHERLGERFHSEKEIDPEVEDVMIPRLFLQPIVENAVEHDITIRGEGSIRIRASRSGDDILLETIHSGALSDSDRENIRRIIEQTDTGGDTSVGLRNVAQRMKLIYGDKGSMAYREADGFVCFQLRFPAGKQEKTLI